MLVMGQLEWIFGHKFYLQLKIWAKGHWACLRYQVGLWMSNRSQLGMETIWLALWCLRLRMSMGWVRSRLNPSPNPITSIEGGRKPIANIVEMDAWQFGGGQMRLKLTMGNHDTNFRHLAPREGGDLKIFAKSR